MKQLRNRYLALAAAKAGINVDAALRIVAYQHELDNLMPKKMLKKVNFNMDLKSLQAIKKVSKALKVSNDAVIGSALIAYIEEEEKRKAYAEYDKKLESEKK
jgi:hypothetical protein